MYACGIHEHSHSDVMGCRGGLRRTLHHKTQSLKAFVSLAVRHLPKRHPFLSVCVCVCVSTAAPASSCPPISTSVMNCLPSPQLQHTSDCKLCGLVSTDHQLSRRARRQAQRRGAAGRGELSLLEGPRVCVQLQASISSVGSCKWRCQLLKDLSSRVELITTITYV